jgi:hypothetical protein
VAICASSATSFTVVATGTALTYQWQVSTNGGTTFTNITAAGSNPTYANWTTSTLNLTGTVSGNNGYQYRAVVSGTCTPSATSAAATLTINAAPSVTTNPANSTTCPGTNTSFTVAASGTGLTYQWQVSSNGGMSFSNITAAGSNPAYSNWTTSTLNLTGVVSGNNGYQYLCVVSGTCTPSVNSAAATLTIDTAPAIISETPSTFINTICTGSNTQFGVTATGTGLTYQWQLSTNGGTSWSNVVASATYSGVTTNTITITNTPVTLNGNLYRVIITGTCSPPDTSAAGTLNVDVAPSITSSPANDTVCAGSNGSFTVVASGSGLLYQWQLSTNGGTSFSNVSNAGVYSGATTATLTITGATTGMAGYEYRCVVSGNCPPNATSLAATLSISTLPSVSSSPSSVTICQGTSTTFTAAGSGTAITYQWQVSTDGGSTYGNITAAGSNPTYSNWTTATLGVGTVAAGNNGYMYRCVISGACSPAVNTTAATLTVTALPTITSSTPGAHCGPGTVTLGATASAGTINWWAASTGGTSLATGTSYTTASISTTTTYYVDATTSGGCVSSSRTAVTATINTIPSASASNTGPYCVSGSVLLSSLPNGMSTYAWSGPAGYTSASQNPAAFAASGAAGTYNVTVTSSGGCTATASTTVSVSPAITVSAVIAGCSFIDSMHVNTPVDSNMVIITASGGTTPYSYAASQASDLFRINVSSTIQVFTAPADNSTHSFTVTDAYGCTASASAKTLNSNPTNIPYTATAGFEMAQCYDNGFDKWVTFQDTNNLAILAIHDESANLGSLSVTIYKDDSIPTVFQTGTGSLCSGYTSTALSRHFVVKSTAAQPFDTAVQVRLYFTNNELDSLEAASINNNVPGVPCTNDDDVSSINDLYVTKYDDPNTGQPTENGTYHDNLSAAAGGIYKVFGSHGSSGPLQKYFNGFQTFYSGASSQHYVQFAVHEFSELWLNGSQSGSALPVEMLYLEAEAINNTYIQLRWATEIEINNNYFAIERTTDGVSWDSIGLVNGHGNTTMETDYSFNDANVIPDVRYYYRLKQVDYNGNNKLTDVVSAIINGQGVFVIQGFNPNPTSGTAYLMFGSSVDQTATIDIYDNIGQRVSTRQVNISKGSVSNPANKFTFDLSMYASGTYNAVITTGDNQIYTKRIIVTR